MLTHLKTAARSFYAINLEVSSILYKAMAEFFTVFYKVNMQCVTHPRRASFINTWDNLNACFKSVLSNFGFMQINGITLAGMTKQNKGEKVNNICDKQGAEGERVFLVF